MTLAKRMYASRLAGGVASPLFSAFVVWFGIYSSQVHGDRLEHVAIAGLLLLLGMEITVYSARRGWLPMFRRAFPGETILGVQS